MKTDWKAAMLSLGCIAAFLICPQFVSAFQETGTRDLVLKSFRQERPAPQESTHSAPATKTTAPGPPIVGVTLWRLRPSVSSDPVKIRGLVHDADQPADTADTKEWTAERVSMESPLSAEQFLRLSFESARRGYLYVIDRDVYADGSASAPTLIFPTLRIRGGDNQVQPGVMIEIPDAQDRPPVFRLKKTRDDQVSVTLTLIVAPQPLTEIRPSREAQTITAEQLAQFEKRWGSKTERVENASSLGKAYTVAEQDAAQPKAHPLSPNDPAPAMLIEALSPPGQPMLVSFAIKVK